MKSQSIQVTGVTKIFASSLFKKKTAVQDISFAVPAGEIVGLLGPNGSGKSTTLRMILGFLYPTEGEILLAGHKAGTVKSRRFLGYLPENPRFQKFLGATEIMRYYARLIGMAAPEREKRISELLELVGLTRAAHEPVQGFSKGMTQRLAIAQALLNSPPILIFDEPMSGLDPLGRREIRQLILSIHEQMPGTTIFFSSHIVGDVEELCSSVVLLRQGRLVKHAQVDALVKPFQEQFEVVAEMSEEGYRMLLKEGKIKVHRVPGGIQLDVEGVDFLARQLGDLRAQGARILRVHSQRHQLEKALFAREEAPFTTSGGTP